MGLTDPSPAPARGGQPVAEPVLAHRVVLVGAESEVGERFGGTDQGEAGLFVLRVVAARVGVVECALEHADGAGQVPALLAGGGQFESVAAGGVEDVLLGA